MGAKVIIYGQSLNSHFLKGLTHCAMVILLIMLMTMIKRLMTRVLLITFWREEKK